ncbi:MAG: hypothetical protein D6732_23295 [Methanobacteriota archaeon]|nr:MAG: hypothetical protein D6732_23295 [Euryarchaeota archaeon]
MIHPAIVSAAISGASVIPAIHEDIQKKVAQVDISDEQMTELLNGEANDSVNKAFGKVIELFDKDKDFQTTKTKFLEVAANWKNDDSTGTANPCYTNCYSNCNCYWCHGARGWR